MHSSEWISMAGLLIPLLGGCPQAIAQAQRTTDTFAPTAAAVIFGRQQQCPGNTFQCAPSLGEQFSDICCETGQTCALDADNQPACCPSGAVCTGNAPSTVPTGRPTVAVSYVSNPYFSFPYVQTNFDNRAQCTSAVSACSKNYDVCVSNLQGGGGGDFGVTIVVPGAGGTTVGGGGSDLGASATQVCSSLSSEACSDLDATQCSEFSAGRSDAGDAASVYRPPLVYCMTLAGAAAAAVALGGIA
ncbi:hypothetical protein NLU13_9016 [Sarocladium strictum]|uniref:Gpi-anchored protein n=1 Tax=Sarocladium strictum TaxID=5046 RepID=A0AA39L3T0_SARSR|nr:hypothetical protein NLU13_9016 [Sarocladium strictum]